MMIPPIILEPPVKTMMNHIKEEEEKKIHLKEEEKMKNHFKEEEDKKKGTFMMKIKIHLVSTHPQDMRRIQINIRHIK